jgi:pimeloyl-ACP methyl ester carboxylesterase
MRVPSSDSVEVVVHDLHGTGRTLLLSHATGFHGHCYVPMAEALADRYHSYALDYRGHGDTAAPHDWPVDWERYGDDATAVAAALAPEGGLAAFGHSMGGACLLMAAHRDPERFDVIVAFEPIVFPPADADAPAHESPLVAGARRRRRSFPSYEDAIANYAAKPPLGAFHPDALERYVRDGFAPSPEGVTLKCDPEHEARTFEMGGSHPVWALLPEIHTRVVVVSGKPIEHTPAAIARPIAERLPNAVYVELDHLDHFGPMVRPAEIAELLAAAIEGDPLPGSG